MTKKEKRQSKILARTMKGGKPFSFVQHLKKDGKLYALCFVAKRKQGNAIPRIEYIGYSYIRHLTKEEMVED